MRESNSSEPAEVVQEDEVLAVLAACRVLVAVSAQSVVALQGKVDLLQLRALVIVASRGSVTLGQLADGAHISLTKASRMCDRMVSMSLLDRSDDPTDRRQLNLTLTVKGRRLVQRVTKARHAAIEPILTKMAAESRQSLVSALRDFAAVSGEPADADLWAMGWIS